MTYRRKFPFEQVVKYLAISDGYIKCFSSATIPAPVAEPIKYREKKRAT
jgi:hypothetical protein